MYNSMKQQTRKNIQIDASQVTGIKYLGCLALLLLTYRKKLQECLK